MSLNVLRDISVFSCSVVPVWVFATLWMVDCQASLSMKFSRQEYWSSLPFPPPGNLADPGIGTPSPLSLLLQADSLPAEPSGFSKFFWSLFEQKCFKTTGLVSLEKHTRLILTVEPFPATAKSLQSCLTLCDPIDSSPPGFPIPGILQARTLEWVAISFSNAG